MPENESSAPVDAIPTPKSLSEKVMDIVTYHKPNEEQIDSITRIREATANLITTMIENCPSNADRSAAIRSARLAMMQANASIVVPDVRL